jgi:hypothetical protein
MLKKSSSFVFKAHSCLTILATARWINKVETDFDFFIKANRDLTPGRRKNAKDPMMKFAGMADVFRQAQKLGGASLVTVRPNYPSSLFLRIPFSRWKQP